MSCPVCDVRVQVRQCAAMQVFCLQVYYMRIVFMKISHSMYGYNVVHEH